ncbi:NUDIX hydrolase [Streptomyces sp. NPDC029674]|uniref:NUDIX hydrolase n=1 Tax=Streptomyces sp. NPDC029674 TaxID=3365297 RepID=UPI00384E5B00
MTYEELVRAAGCVLWRPAPTAPHGIELALVHRPKWSDWSHPKGKLKHGETAAEAAVREVLEETGMMCELGTELPTAHYRDAQGRPKEVRYWAAEATGGHFTPGDEVDRILWLDPAAARERVTQAKDKSLISTFLRDTGL